MKYRIVLWIASFSLLGFAAYELVTQKNAPQNITPPAGLPPIPWPEDNPYSQEKAELGRLLYFDKRLSSDQTVSCASCHNLPCGYGDCRPIAIGIDDTMGSRHSPTVINTAYYTSLFWDGRAHSLEEQCKGPLANTHEMTSTPNPHDAHRQCVERISEIAGYKPLFKKVFGNDNISLDDIAKAIATFERTILSGNSPYDKYVLGDHTALTEEQVRGMTLFKKVGCVNCHGGYNFSDYRFQNIGIGMDSPNPDLGRYMITQEARDWGAFKAPSLREVAQTGPYMHDGSLVTLEDVIDYYDRGGIPNKNLHTLIRPLGLSVQDKQALVSFLHGLSGEGWQQIREPTEYPQ